ncbi:MAG: ATP-binding protein [Chloroflexi bacterium]|nr:ATP-binding protein [Chloroflexota bacterium]
MATGIASDVEKLKEALGPLPEPAVQPAFIVVSGLPGSGKSHFSRRLADRLPCIVLESDVLRQRLFGTPTYSAEESARLFRAVHSLIEDLLAGGVSVILDATNVSERNREVLYHIAEKLKARLILVRVEAPVDVIKERLEARAVGLSPEDHSQADWQVYRKMKSSVDRMSRRHFAADTSRDITPVIDKILREVNR